MVSIGNREAAFFQAITSAGVVYQVTRACNNNKYASVCTCDRRHASSPRIDRAGNKVGNFKWTYCSDNIRFGMNFAHKFLDAREFGNDARVLMNKQNNLAGRTVSII